MSRCDTARSPKPNLGIQSDKRTEHHKNMRRVCVCIFGGDFLILYIFGRPKDKVPQLGALLPFLFRGRVPLLKSTTEKRNGAVILTSLLEKLVGVLADPMAKGVGTSCLHHPFSGSGPGGRGGPRRTSSILVASLRQPPPIILVAAEELLSPRPEIHVASFEQPDDATLAAELCLKELRALRGPVQTLPRAKHGIPRKSLL